MKKILIDNIRSQRELLTENNCGFEVRLTQAVKKIIYEDKTYINISSDLKPFELAFIKKTRNEIIKRAKDYEKKNGSIESLKCRYVDWSSNMPFSCTNAMEVDLNAAYWCFAEYLGYISKELYVEGLTHRKPVRLASLGSVAKSEKCIIYKPGDTHSKYDSSYSVKNPYAKMFYNVSRYIYEVMSLCKNALGNDYYFFWCDAIFFRYTKENLAIVEDIILRSSLEYKKYYIHSFQFNQVNAELIVKSEGHKRYERKFNLSKNNGW